MIEIDGSKGEGGGQIVRTAISLSAVTGKSVRITNIRSGRCNPGLRPQHAKGIQSCAEMCGAKVKGLEIGSKEVEFEPGEVKGGEYKIDVGTAGSVVLILQTLLVPALHADKEVKLEIIGGTEGLWAPSIDYFNEILMRFLDKMGVDVDTEVLKHGFYPKGEGKVYVTIKPCGDVKPIELTERGKLKRVDITGIASKNLKDRKVAERLIKGAKEHFDKFDCEVPIYITTASSGAYVHMHAHYENTVLGSTVVGEKQVKAEDIGEKAAKILKEDMDSGACLDRYMADQILPFMALAGKGKVSVAQVSEHTKTNAHIIEKFLPVKFLISENLIEVKGI